MICTHGSVLYALGSCQSAALFHPGPCGEASNGKVTPKVKQPNLQFEIHGIATGEMLDNIKLRLNDKKKKLKYPVSPPSARRFANEGVREVKKAVAPFGFFKSRVGRRLIFKDRNWIVHYYVQKGPPLTVHSVGKRISGPGSHEPEIISEMRQFPLKRGDTFSVPAYEDGTKAIFRSAKNEGYLRAAFRNKVLINLRRYNAKIDIRLRTGPQFYFGRFVFKNRPYSTCLMQRFITVKEGEPFSGLELLKLQQALENHYLVQQAYFRPDYRNSHNRHIPVNVWLFPPNPARYTAGVGYGTFTGPRVSAGMSLRHLNEEGHHLEVLGKLSRVIGGLAVNYYIPGRHPLTEEWLIGGNIKKFIPKTGRADSLTLTAGFSKRNEHAQTNLNLNFLIERFYVYSRPYIHSHLLYPSWHVNYIKADDLVDPHSGLNLMFTLLGGHENIASTTSFLQAYGRAKVIFSPFGLSRFILRGDLGVTAVHALKRFPLSLRFFAGGINSIRGFAETSIGPGRFLNIGSVEYQQHIYESFYAAIFYDIGAASNHFNDPINRGAGIGGVYASRIGPIKVYLARAYSKPGLPYSVELSIGPEFT